MGDKAEKTREKICQEAYKLFAKKGFKAVTMADVCEKTGLSRGGLYRHYAGTGEIFSEILDKEYSTDDRIERRENAEKILEEMLGEIQEEILDCESSLSLAIYEYASLGQTEFFRCIHEAAKERWSSLIRYGMETDVFKKVDVDQVVDLILYYYQGLRMWSRILPFDRRTGEHYAQTVRQMLLKEQK